MEKLKQSRKRYIFIVSDATGQTCQRVVDAALKQFDTTEAIKKLIPNVRTSEQIEAVIDEAHKFNGIVVYTFVSPEPRQQITELSRRRGVPVVDLMGPLLTRFSDLLEISPMALPGLSRQLDDSYFKRIDAVDFTIKHDDGLALSSLDGAEIVLLGVSRTSKTPVSIYLAYRGWKVANIPMVSPRVLPAELLGADKRKVVALTIKPSRLQRIRMERQHNLGDTYLGNYTDLDRLKEEVIYARRLYEEFGCPILDVTYKSIEETATEVMRIIYAQMGVKKGKIKME